MLEMSASSIQRRLEQIRNYYDAEGGTREMLSSALTS